MDINTVGTLIGSLGFPIACCIGLGWFIYTAFEKITSRSELREEKLYMFITQAQAVNQELTTTNAQFLEVLNTYKSDLSEIKEDISDIKERLN